jgi:aspartate/tyrosine/aromatic aminotransferase
VPLMRLAGLFGRHARAQTVERVADRRQADVRVLEALRELGSDLAQPRVVRHFVSVPDRRGAELVAEVLERDGWSTSVQDDPDGGCLVVAARAEKLSEPLVRRTRSRLETIAAEHGGLYDGWEVETT